MPQEWKEIYSLHHEIIDAQHQELFHLANKVEALDPKKTTKEDLSILFKKFFSYMREHFKDEEAYMKSIDYPLLDDHKKLHEVIIDNLTNILKHTKGIEAIQAKMKVIAHQWLVEHILENDLKIEKWRCTQIIVLEDYNPVENALL